VLEGVRVLVGVIEQVGVRDGIRPVGVGVVEPVGVLVGPRVIVGVVVRDGVPVTVGEPVRVGVAVGPAVGIMEEISVGMGGTTLVGRSSQSVGVGRGEFGGVGSGELNSAVLDAVAGCLPAGAAAGADSSVSSVSRTARRSQPAQRLWQPDLPSTSASRGTRAENS